MIQSIFKALGTKGRGTAIALMLSTTALSAADANALKTSNVSLRNEVQHAIEKGLTWLEKDQN